MRPGNGVSIDQLNRHQNVRPNGGMRKKSTRAKPVLAVAGVKYRSGQFLRTGRAFFAPGSGDLGRTATANLILITRQPRRSPIAAGGIGVTLLPLECRSGSLRADSYLCAAPEARDGRQTERKREKRDRGG